MSYMTKSVPQWPGWKTNRLIGRGNYGAVYEIQRDNFGTVEKAALKAISIPRDSEDLEEYYNSGYDEDSLTEVFQNYLEDVVAEYSMMRKMNGCVNIVNCDDILYEKQEDGIGWNILIRMELLTPITKSLSAVVPEETVYRVARDICNALIHCKEFGIIHRDIKPQNIFVSRFGDYKLGDFGIAKTVEKTMGGTKIGTYNYMAPEVYLNQPYGAAVDIYSLGLVLYWLLNERRMPFMPLPPEKLKAGMDEQVRHRRLSGEPLPPPAHGSENLKRIVLKACAYDPKDRYHSAAEMLADLDGEACAVTSKPLKPIPVEEPEQDRTEPPAAERTELASEHTTVAVPEKETLEEEKHPATGKVEDSVWVAPKKTFGGVKKLVSFSSIAVLIAGALFWGYFNVHFWEEATCTEPEICKVCGAQQAPALGHNWIEATYTKPETCTRCKKIRGTKLEHEHQWKNEKCELCGALKMRITDQPDDATAWYGDQVVFKVEAVGTELSYQWYLQYNNSVYMMSWENDSECSVKYSSACDGRSYYCVITDKYGNSVQTDAVTIRLK